MRILVLSCEVLARMLYAAAATSPHVIDIQLVQKSLHDKPQELCQHLQQLIDDADTAKYDALVLGYGLCSNSVVGLTAPPQTVTPRAHDCITLFLGNRDTYSREFREHPGTYWYAPDYMERTSKGDTTIGMGSNEDDAVQEQYADYLARYGKDNADYLMQVMGAWRNHYDRAAYICINDVPMPDYRPQVEVLAGKRGWNYVEIAGQALLIRRLLHGDWDDEAFLTIEAGETISPSYDSRVMACSCIQGELDASPNR